MKELKNRAETTAAQHGQLVGAQGIQGHAGKLDASLVGSIHAPQAIQQRRLAAPGGSPQGEPLPRRQFQGHPAKDRATGIHPAELLCAQQNVRVRRS